METNVRRPTLIPLVSLALVSLALSACGKKDDASYKDATAADNGAGDNAAAGPARDPWPMVAPLLAGSHGGSCTRTPQLDRVNATIALAADGKLTAPDANIDMRKPQLIVLTRETSAGHVKAGGMLSMDSEKGPVLNLLDTGKPEGGSAGLVAGEKALNCPIGTPLQKLRSQPVYQAMAQLMEIRAGSLKCVDAATRMTWKDTPLTLAGGVFTLGADTFNLAGAEREMLTISAQDNQVTYFVGLPGKPPLTIIYDLTGRPIGVQAGQGQDLTHACQVEA